MNQHEPLSRYQLRQSSACQDHGLHGQHDILFYLLPGILLAQKHVEGSAGSVAHLQLSFNCKKEKADEPTRKLFRICLNYVLTPNAVDRIVSKKKRSDDAVTGQ